MSRLSASVVRALSACAAASCVAAGVTSCGAAQREDAAELCAIMSDSIGLYVDNPVTQMGYRIGTVSSITPKNTEVEVRFTIDTDHPIPADVKAVIRSTSILADRSLELVGNYFGGPKLAAEHCIPRGRSATPLSISQVIGSATNFVNGISPSESTSIQDALSGMDKVVRGNGPALNSLLSTSSALLDNPDQSIADIGSIVRNVVQLTDTLRESSAPLKQILLDMPQTDPYLINALRGTQGLTNTITELVVMVNDIELTLGDNIQLALDTTADSLRHLSPHYKGIANMLNPVPRWINTMSYYANNHQFNLIGWSPPLFRVKAPDGWALCGSMNTSMPGSCANVNGQPHAVDVALLQYVLMEAQRR